MAKQSLTEVNANCNTMTSREIAELTGKRHADVLRDIDRLLETLDAELRFGYKSTTYKDLNGRENRMFSMDRDSTYCLVAGYDVNSRMRIIKRWQELEANVLKLPDFTNPAEAARAWAMQYERAEQLKLENESNQKALEEAKPMIDFHEEVFKAEGELHIDTVCQTLFGGSMKPSEFRNWLKHNGWMDKRQGMNKPTAWAIGQKYMAIKIEYIERINKVIHTPVITPKGLVILRHLIRTNELFVSVVPRECRQEPSSYMV